MAEDKKYYWLKLQKDFFTQPKMKKLRRIAGGAVYTIIYLKLQLLSIETEGVLMFEDIEDDFIEELALKIDEEPDDIKMTVMYLINKGLMEETNTREYALIEAMNNIGSETDAARRVRKHRKKMETLQCNTPVTIGNTEKEIEKDKELESELDGEVEKKKKKETFVSIVSSYTTNSDLLDYLNEYVEMRRKDKKFTTRALKLNLEDLDELSNDDDMKIAIVKQSIKKSWKAFYPLKQENAANRAPKEKPLPSWYTEAAEAKEPEKDPKEEHMKSLKMQYELYLKWGHQEKLENVKLLYKDLTGRNIEEDVEGEKNE